jgi:uncharacterized protein
MEEIIGRKAQIDVFKEALASRQSEFIAVTGRRRIGKTYLIKSFFEEAICFHVTGLQHHGTKDQLQAFANELSFRSNRMVGKPDNWIDAFAMLRQYVSEVKTDTKKVIFLDELPWMDNQRGFLQVLAHFWNNWAAWEKNIILVIAGSSTSWIVNKVYNDTGGLHNRVTKRIWLQPFSLAETEIFLKYKGIDLLRYEIVLLYMSLGGVPFYLNEVKTGETSAQAIQRLCFAKDGILKSEFENLYAAIFRQSDIHLKIVRTLAKHNYGLGRNELLQKANIANSGSITKILEELTVTGYINYMLPYGKKSNNGIYILADFYSRFYLNFIEEKKITNWTTQTDSQSYKIWSGLAFEWLCHMHTDQILKGLGINGISTSVSYLNIKDDTGAITAQIDMLIDRADNAINLCEIKFYNDIYHLDQTTASTIRNRMSQLRQHIKRRKSIFPVLITPFGCSKNAHYLGLITNDLDLDTLFL